MNTEKLNKQIGERIEKMESDAEQQFKVQIKPQEIVNFNDLDSELQISKNYVCALCQHLPVAPVKMCNKCEKLYCDKCLESLKTKKENGEVPEDAAEEKEEFSATCCNEKCGQNQFSQYVDIGRHVRNVIQSFEFQENDEIMSYQKMIAFQRTQFKNIQKYKCEFCNAENFSKTELISHQQNDCQDIMIECTKCDFLVKRSDFDNQELHWCEKNLKTMIDKLRLDMKDCNNKAKDSEKEQKNVECRIKDHQRRIDDLTKQNAKSKEDMEKTNKLIEQLKNKEQAIDDASMLIDKHQLIFLKVPEESIEISYSGDKYTPKDLQKLVTSPYHDKVVFDNNSWVNLKLAKPCVVNGFGFMFEKKTALKNLQIYVKLKQNQTKEQEAIVDQVPEETNDDQVDLKYLLIQEQQSSDQIDSTTEPVDIKIDTTVKTEETKEKSSVNEDFLKEGFILVKDTDAKDLDKVVFNKANLQVTEVRIQFGEQEAADKKSFALQRMGLYY